MRGIITETMRALHQPAAVTVSHGPTIALRLDKNLTQGHGKLLIVTLWTERKCDHQPVDECYVTKNQLVIAELT